MKTLNTNIKNAKAKNTNTKNTAKSTEKEVNAQANDSYNADIDPVEQFARGVRPNKAFYDKVIATKDNGKRKLVLIFNRR